MSLESHIEAWNKSLRLHPALSLVLEGPGEFRTVRMLAGWASDRGPHSENEASDKGRGERCDVVQGMCEEDMENEELIKGKEAAQPR